MCLTSVKYSIIIFSIFFLYLISKPCYELFFLLLQYLTCLLPCRMLTYEFVLPLHWEDSKTFRKIPTGRRVGALTNNNASNKSHTLPRNMGSRAQAKSKEPHSPSTRYPSTPPSGCRQVQKEKT